MLVKIMGNEDLADDNNSKSFELLSNVDSIIFDRDESGQARLEIKFNDKTGIEIDLRSSAYVMNDAGKTIQTINPNKYI